MLYREHRCGQGSCGDGLAANLCLMPNGKRIRFFTRGVGLPRRARRRWVFLTTHTHASPVICITLSAVQKVHKRVGLGEHSSRRGPVWPELPSPEVHEARAPRPQHRWLYQTLFARRPQTGHSGRSLAGTPKIRRRHGRRFPRRAMQLSRLSALTPNTNKNGNCR
jgi:hypothetical protein